MTRRRHAALPTADERTAEVRCVRCHGVRWVRVRPASGADPTDYVCLRCRAARAGRNVIDPLVRVERRERGRNAARQRRRPSPQPRSALGTGQPITPEPPAPGSQSERPA
jgi:DNA-directed RNA polymerase subunit RPC12/RpoP